MRKEEILAAVDRQIRIAESEMEVHASQAEVGSKERRLYHSSMRQGYYSMSLGFQAFRMELENTFRLQEMGERNARNTATD